MNRIVLSEANRAECISKAVGVLKKGGVILYPTDTLYGLGADAFNSEAVDKIYELKGRDENKPIHAVFADLAMIERYAYVSDTTRRLVNFFLPGALTLVLPKKDSVTGGIARNRQNIGIRIPENDFCIELARAFDSPFTTTSANIAGLSSSGPVQNILQQFEARVDLIDLVINAGELPERLPSTVVDLSVPEPKILREGAIPSDEIWKVLHRA